MPSSHRLIASGNLATSRRTIMGVLGQCALLGIDEQQQLTLFTNAGLPQRAMQQLDFPISLTQELQILNALVNGLGAEVSPAITLFTVKEQLGIESLGVLGMAMRHANSAIEALQVCLTYPQLSGGHSQLLVRRQGGELQFTFRMTRPRLRDVTRQDIDRLVQYCVVLDLLSSLRNIDGIVESAVAPLYIHLPFPQPPDWPPPGAVFPCPVHFAMDEARLTYAATLESIATPHANPLLYKSYAAIAENMSRMLAEELTLTERVSRWLWAYTPPPRRGEVANLLCMSERNLTRQLGAENTSFSQLLAQVQEERARNFLSNNRLSVAEISERLGYADPAAFSRAFRQWTGVPPGQWRINARGE